MKVLLDENLPHRLRLHLGEHEVVTAAFAGWTGVKNGALPQDAGFEVLITADRNLRYQQNLSERRIAIIELGEQIWPLLREHMTEIRTKLESAVPGSFQIVACKPVEANPENDS